MGRPVNLSDSLLINSIFLASEGEGVRIGLPQVFVRFQGCSIGCENCDTKESWEFGQDYSMNFEDVVQQIQQHSHGQFAQIKNVSITGGDPLHPKHVPGVIKLAKRLKSLGYEINLEASGSRVVDEVFDLVDFISFDFKTPSTGVKTPVSQLEKLIVNYSSKYQIKSVVYDKKDYEASFEIFMALSNKLSQKINWIVTPCFNNGEEFPRDRYQQIIQMNMEFGGPFRVIGQQHKWMWGPDKAKV